MVSGLLQKHQYRQLFQDNHDGNKQTNTMLDVSIWRTNDQQRSFRPLSIAPLISSCLIVSQQLSQRFRWSVSFSAYSKENIGLHRWRHLWRARSASL